MVPFVQTSGKGLISEVGGKGPSNVSGRIPLTKTRKGPDAFRGEKKGRAQRSRPTRATEKT